MRKGLFVILYLVLTGCAVNSGIVSMGSDTYMVSRQAATGFSGSGTLKAEAFQEANQYCMNQGKKLQVVSTHEASPPYIFGNFPKAEVQFMCLNANDPQLTHSRLEKDLDVVKTKAVSKCEGVVGGAEWAACMGLK